MGKRILIVDDAAFMRMMIKDILTKNGYEVVGEAENGAVGGKQYQGIKAGFGYHGHYHAGNGWHYRRESD